MEPSYALSRTPIMLSKVDLPEPEGPIIDTNLSLFKF